MFTADFDEDGWTELTRSHGPVVRLRTTDLQRARRERGRLRAADRDVAVVLDIRVYIGEDFRAARRAADSAPGADPVDSVHYVGTLTGLVGLIRDLFVAEVADGVTLVPVTPDQDVRALALASLSVLEASTDGRVRAAG